MKRLRVVVVIAIAAAVGSFARCGGAVDDGVRVLMDNVSPGAVAVCGEHLYWIGSSCDGGLPTTAGDLNRIPLDGGANEIVLSNVGDFLACGGNTLYFWQWPSTLSGLPLDGGAPFVLAIALDEGNLAANDSSVYWTDPKRGIYTAVDGSAVAIASAPGSAGGVASDDHVYWSADEFASSDGGLLDGGLLGVPFDGGAPSVLWPGQSLSGEAVTPSHLYWVGYYPATLMQLDLDSGLVSAIPTDASPVQESPVVTNGQRVYWLSYSGSEVHRIDVSGENDSVVLTLDGTDNFAIGSLALGDAWLYASLPQHPLGLPCGRIVKVAK